jgi:hypothetical protein
MGGIMRGTFEGFELTFGSLGQQYTTIDGQVYLTWFDAADPKLRGLGEVALVEFEARPGPTVLCTSPAIREDLPSATLLRVLRRAGGL